MPLRNCSLTEGGLNLLHEADDDAVIRLESTALVKYTIFDYTIALGSQFTPLYVLLSDSCFCSLLLQLPFHFLRVTAHLAGIYSDRSTREINKLRFVCCESKDDDMSKSWRP